MSPAERHAANQRAHAARLAQALRDYKVEKGCADCGYDAHHAGLEFDHRPGELKIMNVGVLAGKGRGRRMWEEAAKCDVVCRTCHGIRTWNRMLDSTDLAA